MATATTRDRESRNAIGVIAEDGLLCGVTGAAVVALFFLVVDLLEGHPFYTPTLLGSALFLGQDVANVTAAQAPMVMAYTGLHVLLFLIVGTGAAFLVHEMKRQPHVAVVLILLLVCFEGAFFALAAGLMPGVLGELGVGMVIAANLLSAGAMGAYLWHRHPDAFRAIDHVWDDA
jgi:hypothetical protein